MSSSSGRDYSLRNPDYDDAWLVALAQQSSIVFDVGANVGQAAAMMFSFSTVEKIFLIEPNPEALSAAADTFIHRGWSPKAVFIPAFACSIADEVERLWTVGTGSAASKYEKHAVSASRARTFIDVPTTMLDEVCTSFQVIPDLVKVDVEGAEHDVLQGSRNSAVLGRTRFLVEMHSFPGLEMVDNAMSVLEWCSAVGYAAWYLKEHLRLEKPQQIERRGRCHLLLQPAGWTYPGCLAGIRQGDQPVSPPIPGVGQETDG